MSDWDFQNRREETARQEVGCTQIRPAVARSLLILFLLIVFSVPFAEHLATFRDYATGERRSPLPQVYDALFLLPAALKAPVVPPSTGILAHIFTVNRHLLKEIKAFEETLDDQSVIGKWLRPKVQYLLTGWLGVGNEKAYCGEPPWLFYRQGVDYLSGPSFLLPAQLRKRVAGGSEWVTPVNPDPRGALIDLKEQLDRRGIVLIVMPTPIKPMIHPEKLTGREDPRRSALQNPSYDHFTAYLEQRGVLLFDPAPALMEAKLKSGRPQYLMTDTHWRPEAMALAAEELKKFIQKHVPLDAVPDPGYRMEASELVQLGDLAVMLDLSANQQIFPREKISLWKVLEKEGREPWKAQQAADVLVLGDSFSNIYSLGVMGWGEAAGFVEQLSYRLKRPLDRITRNDNGSYATREFLAGEMARGRDRLAGKRLVIYQFAIRELAVGDWKRIDLKLGTSPETKYLALPPGGEWIVRGRINAVSAVPRPGTVPYKDHVMAIHMTDLQAEGRPLAETDAVVYMKSMTDHVWTPAARYRSGETVEIRLRAWSDVADQYEGINRSELDDTAHQFAEPCWGEAVQPSS
jgi:alginate O-acetyltransferase complex protein AlgJ